VSEAVANIGDIPEMVGTIPYSHSDNHAFIHCIHLLFYPQQVPSPSVVFIWLVRRLRLGSGCRSGSGITVVCESMGFTKSKSKANGDAAAAIDKPSTPKQQGLKRQHSRTSPLAPMLCKSHLYHRASANAKILRPLRS
jgi:hypothetical protein